MICQLFKPTQSLFQFGNQYFPSKTCEVMPRWGVSSAWMPENHQNYAEHPECAVNPLHAAAGDYAPPP